MTTRRMLISVCVIAVAAASAYGTPWRWTPLDYPGGTYTEVHAVSGNRIVGRYLPPSAIYDKGFVHDDSTWTSLAFPGSFYTEASGIDGNRIVGSYIDSNWHGFLYNGSTWTSLDYPGGTTTYVSGISGNKIAGTVEVKEGET